MEDNFKLEIIRPEKIIFSDNAKMITLPLNKYRKS